MLIFNFLHLDELVKEARKNAHLSVWADSSCYVNPILGVELGKVVYDVVWDHILRQLPQSLFAKLAAGPPGRLAKYEPDKE